MQGKVVDPIDKYTDRVYVNLPKIFRRQIDYEVGTKAYLINESSFADYLKHQRQINSITDSDGNRLDKWEEYIAKRKCLF